MNISFFLFNLSWWSMTLYCPHLSPFLEQCYTPPIQYERIYHVITVSVSITVIQWFRMANGRLCLIMTSPACSYPRFPPLHYIGGLVFCLSYVIIKNISPKHMKRLPKWHTAKTFEWFEWKNRVKERSRKSPRSSSMSQCVIFSYTRKDHRCWSVFPRESWWHWC